MQHDPITRERWPAEEIPPIHVAITGAAGRIGYSLLYRVAAGAMFGPDQPIDLRLLEASSQLNCLRGVGLELQDCAFPLLHKITLTDQPKEAFEKADWIIMLAGEPVMTANVDRHRLLQTNAPVYADHGAAINEVAQHARVLVVAEPCNTNCLMAMRHAPNVPASHWHSLNRVDRMRATSMIAAKAGVPVSKVNRVMVWGNRSEKIYVDFHNSYIEERPAREVITDMNWVRTVLEPTVQRRNREIFELRNSTPAATTVQAILGSMRSLTTRTPLHRRFGAGVMSDGTYDVRRGLIFGLPLRSEDGHSWTIVRDLYLDDYAQERIAENVQELDEEAASVGL
ncbi:MAG: malate dehydrogenase [Planctomycetes bacterium]|nr:malate dehydrogenase [Planctomycetota bacterium]